MPSGSKKRKNAKKKQEKGGGSNPTMDHHPPTNSQEGDAGKDDDRNGHGEKGSDSGDIHSPTSQSLTDDQRNADSPRSDFQMEGSEYAVNTQKTEASSEDKEVVLPSVETSASENNVVSIEFVKRSGQISSVSDDASSGSSSDEDSRSGDNPSKREVEKPLVSDLPTSDEKTLCSNLPTSDEKPLDSASDEKSFDSNLSTAGVVVPSEQVVSVWEEVTAVVETAPIENSAVSGGVEAVVKENEEKVTVLVTAESSSSSAGVETVVKENEEKETVLMPAESSASEKPGNSGALPKEAEKAESIEKEIVVNRLPVQRTSWMSCCGLFDLVTGSNR